MITASYTRPSDTTVYAANDAVGESPAKVLTFDKANRISRGSGFVYGAICSTTNINMDGLLRLYLYEDVVDAIADNAVFTLNQTPVGYINFSGWTTEGAGSAIAISIPTFNPIFFTCADRALYGLCSARTSFTPTSGQIINFNLLIKPYD
jgi:hypothetical protein